MKKYFKAATAVKVVSCALFLLVFNACKKNELSSVDNSDAIVVNVPLSQIKIDSVFNVSELPSAEKERGRLQQRNTHTDFSETGFYLEPNGTVKIQVDVTEGKRTPILIIGTLSRYAASGTSYDGGLSYIPLKPGLNEIKDPKAKGGLLYLQFANSYNVGVQKCKVNFLSGMLPVPYFKLGKTTNDEWKAMLSYFNNVPNVVLSSRRAMVVVSLKNAYLYQKEDLTNILGNLDQLYDSYDQFSGLDGTTALDQPNIHKILMTEMDQGPTEYLGYMFTTGRRIAIVHNYINQLITSNGFLNASGYSVWHEMGHMYQMSSWTWKSVSEATVQLYAHVALRKLGIAKSELNRQGVWGLIAKYLAAPNRDFTKSLAGIDDITMKYWVRTGMFYQLWLQYGDDFYIRLHKYYREKRPLGSSDEDGMSSFMLYAAVISGNDLTDFFKKWGFNLKDSYYQKVKDLGLPAPKVDITTLRD